MSEPATLPMRRVLQMDGETLAFFLVLYRTESLPKAAAEMNISLSSANRQLARLRKAWADPLFVRSGLLMKATPAAARRYDRVQRVVREIEALTLDEEVQPALLKQIVRIATYDNAFAVGLATVFGELQTKLPGVQFRAVQADEHMFEDLRADRLDMAFYARQGVQPGIHSTPLFTTPYACVTRRGHPLEKVVERHGHLDREDLARFRTVLVNAQPDRNREPNSPANGWFNPPSADKVAMVLPSVLSRRASGASGHRLLRRHSRRIRAVCFRDRKILDSPLRTRRSRAHRQARLARAHARRSRLPAHQVRPHRGRQKKGGRTPLRSAAAHEGSLPAGPRQAGRAVCSA